MIVKNKWPKIHTHKYFKFILSALIILLVAFCFFYSLKTWSDFHVKYESDITKIKTDIEKSISNSSTDKLSDLIKKQTEITKSINKLCYISPVIKWQSFIKDNKNNLDNCNKHKAIFTKLMTEYKKVTDYLTAESKLSEIISTANSETNLNNSTDKWVNNENIWKTAADSSNKVLGLNDVKEKSVTNLILISTAWKNLSDANISKDRTGFESAHSNLNAAYDTLFEISELNKTNINKLISNFITEYNKI